MVHNPSCMKANEGQGQARGQGAISTRFLLAEGKTPSLVGLGVFWDGVPIGRASSDYMALPVLMWCTGSAQCVTLDG